MVPDSGERGGILIDSTSLPNCARMLLAAVSSHTGIVSNEVRVIYVVRQKKELPFFMRYVPGSVVDASTVRRMLLELEGMGINVSFALLDAGYYNGRNTDAFYEAGFPFVTRIHSNNKVFTDTVGTYRAGLEAKENLVRHNGGLYYIRQARVKLGIKSDRKAYGYLCFDLTT